MQPQFTTDSPLLQYQLFPSLTTDEYRDLKASIAERGVLVPVVYDENGAILDGHHRVQVCQELGIADWPRDVRTGLSEPAKAALIVTLNRDRRHLNESQRAMVAARLATLPMGANQHTPIGGTSQPEAAALLNVGERSVQRARQVLDAGAPELQQAVIAGEMAVSTAATLTELPKAEQAEVVAHGEREILETARRIREEKARQKRELREEKARQAQKAALVTEAKTSPTLYVAHAENLPLSDGSVDVIITSPPYNLGASEWPMGGEGRKPRDAGIGYQDAIPERDYQAWQVAVLVELYRVATPGASLFYNHKVRQREGRMIHPMDWLRQSGNPWVLRQEIIWDRGSTHNHSSVLFWPEDERIYWLTKGRPIIPDAGIGQPSVWRFFGPVPSTWHPAPFNSELPKRCLEAIGRPGITVLDPFGGSMTTCAVALAMGYEAIGVDCNPEYVEQARKEHGWASQQPG